MSIQTFLESQYLLLVGCGKMGGALLDGWLEKDLAPQNIIVIEPHIRLRDDLSARGVRMFEQVDDIPPDFSPDVIVLAVKPQIMKDVISDYHRFSKKAVFMSIAAGTPIGYFEEYLGPKAEIVRVMPNTPASIGRGTSVLIANGQTTKKHRITCNGLMEAVGSTSWLEDEALMDAVTAVSGSGPAYVFLLIECLEKAGVAVGLPTDLAKRLAIETVSGAGELARQSDEHAHQLRINVTSPGGTTEAALNILMAPDGIQGLLNRAVAAAKSRGRTLSK